MSRKIVLFIATSLDGYIATEDDSLVWLFKVAGEGDNGYSEFFDTVDTIIMGRRTYDWIMKEESGNFPYKNKECYVFSKTEHIENESEEIVQFVNDDMGSFLSNLREKDGENIWIVGGGELLHSVIKDKFIDEFIITVAPVIIGKGIPLFKKSDVEIELELISIRRFNQFAELHYTKKK